MNFSLLSYRHQKASFSGYCSSQSKWLAEILLLPPSNEVYEGYVFTPVCHSVHRGKVCVRGGACIQGVLHPAGIRQTSPPLRYWGIRSTSGRYASYWNAFLLLRDFTWGTYLQISCTLAPGPGFPHSLAPVTSHGAMATHMRSHSSYSSLNSEFVALSLVVSSQPSNFTMTQPMFCEMMRRECSFNISALIFLWGELVFLKCSHFSPENHL